MWHRWMILAYITNGLSAFGAIVVQKMGLPEAYLSIYLGLWYLTGLAVSLAALAIAGQRMLLRELLLGGLMGMFSSGMWFLLTGALARGMPGYLVFPIAIGGSLSVVSLVGVLVLKERLNVYGCLGVLCGIASLVVLSTAP